MMDFNDTESASVLVGFPVQSHSKWEETHFFGRSSSGPF